MSCAAQERIEGFRAFRRICAGGGCGGQRSEPGEFQKFPAPVGCLGTRDLLESMNSAPRSQPCRPGGSWSHGHGKQPAVGAVSFLREAFGGAIRKIASFALFHEVVARPELEGRLRRPCYDRRKAKIILHHRDLGRTTPSSEVVPI